MFQACRSWLAPYILTSAMNLNMGRHVAVSARQSEQPCHEEHGTRAVRYWLQFTSGACSLLAGVIVIAITCILIAHEGRLGARVDVFNWLVVILLTLLVGSVTVAAIDSICHWRYGVSRIAVLAVVLDAVILFYMCWMWPSYLAWQT